MGVTERVMHTGVVHLVEVLISPLSDHLLVLLRGLALASCSMVTGDHGISMVRQDAAELPLAMHLGLINMSDIMKWGDFFPAFAPS